VTRANRSSASTARTGRQATTDTQTLEARIEAREVAIPNREMQFRALEAAPTGMLMVDMHGTIVLVNAQIEKIFGYERDELIGHPIRMLLQDLGSERDGTDGAIAVIDPRPLGGDRDLYVVRKDGTEVLIEIGISELRMPEGSYVLGSVADISNRKGTELAIRAALREKEVLLKEIHHRVKNNLQVISSLLSLQALQLPAGPARTMLAESQSRVRSIALVHETLYQSKNFSLVNFKDYLRSLLEGLAHTHSAHAREIQATIDVGDVRLAVDAAIPCGLIVNELVTNAFKHAFPDGRAGSIHVQVDRDGQSGVTLTVSDDGVGMPEHIKPGTTPSLGLELVFTFAQQLEATIEIVRDRGTAFILRFTDDGTDALG
jgi:PAS domain S-box-containing protein